MRKLFALLLVALLACMLGTVALAESQTTDEIIDDAQDTPKEPEICSHPTTKIVVSAYPTCEASGSNKIVCATCGEVIGEETVAPLGHHWVNETVVEPTCLEKGYTTHTCDRLGCGKTETYAYKDAMGHRWSFVRVVEAPTCEKKGFDLHVCLACGTNAYCETPATGHDYVVTATKDPTCTEAGYEQKTCQNCANVVTTTKPALGHKWTAWQIDVSPSCTASGLQSRYCTRACCVEPLSQTTVKESEVLPAHGHLLDPDHATKNADGTMTGTCVYCSATVTLKTAGEKPQTPGTNDKPAAGTPSTPSTPTTPSKPSTPTTPSKPSNPGTGSQASIPKTGDTTSNIGYILLAVAVVGLATVTLSKRRANG